MFGPYWIGKHHFIHLKFLATISEIPKKLNQYIQKIFSITIKELKFTSVWISTCIGS